MANEATNGAQLVPKHVAKLAEAIEDGKIIVGGIRAGRTWALRIASANPHQKQLRPHPSNKESNMTTNTPPIKFTPAWFAYIGAKGGNANTKAQRDVRKLAKKGAGRPKHNATGKGKP